MESRKARFRAAASVVLLAGIVAACAPVMPVLPDESEIERPVLSSSESRELVQILNSHRRDWLTHWATSPSSSGADAIVEIASSPEHHTIIYYYSDPDEGHCSMFGTGLYFEGHQTLPASICRRLDVLLLESPGQG